MHTASSPPAWGFGSTKRMSKTKSDVEMTKVGPNSYKHSLKVLKKEPEYSIAKRFGETVPSFKFAPGAGAYNIPTKVINLLIRINQAVV